MAMTRAVRGDVETFLRSRSKRRLEVHNGHAYTTCPVCGSERSATVNIGDEKKIGLWKCWSCKESGHWTKFLELCGQTVERAPARPDPLARMSARVVSGPAPTGRAWRVERPANPTPTPTSTPAKADTGKRPSPFDWRPELAAECEATLWSDAGAAVLHYLQRGEEFDRPRHLSDAAIRAFGLGALRTSRGWYLTIPLRDRAGVVNNVRFRTVPTLCASCGGKGCDEKSCDNGRAKKMYFGCTGIPLGLFGVDRLPKDTRRPILVVEGELDVVAFYDYGARDAVVSGTGGAGNFRDEWLDALEPYNAFVLAYDNDGPGASGADALAAKLGKYRCMKATLPRKDVGDCLIEGVPSDEIERAIDDSASFVELRIESVTAWRDEVEDEIRNPGRLVGTPSGSASLDAAIAGWRPGMWAITGDTSSGKSSLATWLADQQSQLDIPTGIASFEDRPIGVTMKLLRMGLHRDPIDCTVAQRSNAFDQIGRRPLYLLRHRGSMTGDEMIEAVRFGVRRHGIRFWLIDHLGYLYDAAADNARQLIEAFVRNLHMVGVADECSNVLIAHPNRARNARRGDRVRISDLKEASAIEQDATGGLVVVRGKPEADGRMFSEIHVDKLRGNYGSVGSKVKLYYDPEAATYADRYDVLPVARRHAVSSADPVLGV